MMPNSFWLLAAFLLVHSADGFVVPSTNPVFGQAVGFQKGDVQALNGQVVSRAGTVPRMGLFDNMFGSTTPQQAASPETEGDWQELKDEGTGTPYYWNKVTGETTWEQPEIAEPGQEGDTSQTGGLFGFLMPKEEEAGGRALVNRYRDVVSDVEQPSDLPFPAELMQDTFLEGRVLQRVYRASSDGWGAANFHANCDLKGPCVVYAETEDGYRFGAFNPEGWQSDDDYRNNLNAFLFCWPDQSAEPVKLPKIGGGETALFDYARSGPHFGADGLIIGPGQSAVTGLFAGPDTNDPAAQGQLRVTCQPCPRLCPPTVLRPGGPLAQSMPLKCEPLLTGVSRRRTGCGSCVVFSFSFFGVGYCHWSDGWRVTIVWDLDGRSETLGAPPQGGREPERACTICQ